MEKGQEETKVDIGTMVVDMETMELVSLSLSGQFKYLFGNDGLSRADILRDLEGALSMEREQAIKDYYGTQGWIAFRGQED